MTAFRCILVANRGEIACRIMRTAKAMGYRTAAVYSDADAGALHVRQADVSTRIGPADVRASYLDAQAIIAAAKRVGADAIHPGYGFLSENADFARACRDAGLTFIGPSPEAIAAMGNKAAAKRRMLEAGVPCVPGFQGQNASDEVLLREGTRIGFPLMVKAAAGGGGRGMRLVHSAADLPAALAGARSEALNAFGSDELILEKAVVDARHVEVQVLADTHGACIHLSERDCSVQRRHQKVLEEAPSPAVSPELRAKMGAAAVAAAKAIGYSNAGTVEFLLAPDGAFYFLEMNTRLQVEHPVTEAVTGLDLVELQIRIAAGEPLPIGQSDSPIFGHAIEARLYAEAPHTGFLPQPGELVAWQPPRGLGVRVDHGLNARETISPHYDPMLAKIIAHGATREEARRRLVQALEETVALGTGTNRAFLIAALQHPEFVAGHATTQFIPRNFANIEVPAADDATLALAAVLLFEASARRHGHSPERAWSSSGSIAWPMRLVVGDEADKPIACTVIVNAGGNYRVERNGATTEIVLAGICGAQVRWRSGGAERSTAFAQDGETLYLQGASGDLSITDILYAPPAASSGEASGELRAPMNGRIVSVLAAVGDKVEKGQRLVILEAMKMQHEMVARVAGRLTQIAVKPGDQVATRQLLAQVQAD